MREALTTERLIDTMKIVSLENTGNNQMVLYWMQLAGIAETFI